MNEQGMIKQSENESGAAPPTKSYPFVDVLRFLVFVGVGVGILYLMYSSQQAAYLEQCRNDGIATEQCSLLDKLVADFRSASPLWLAMTVIAFALSNVFRALRWNMMLRTFGSTPRFVNAFLTIMLGYFANLGFPRLGEIVRPAAMARYEKISLERVVGTVVVGRLVDVVSILIVTAVALLLGREKLWNTIAELADLGGKVDGLQNVALAAAALGVFVLGLFWWQRKRLLETALGKRMVKLVKGFGEGLQTVARVQSPLLFVVYSVLIWMMYILMTYFVVLAFSPTSHLGVEASLVTFVAGGWGIVIPSPGGMGTFHFLSREALFLYGIDRLNGFSWANISFFTINLGGNVLLGLVALLSLPALNKQ